MEIGNTILDGNSGANIDGTATSLGYNISSDDGGGNLTGPGDQINTAPLIGNLQDNGGPTLTHALLPGSPAIDAGDPNFNRRLFTTSEEVLLFACSMVASISVRLRCNRHIARSCAKAASNSGASPDAAMIPPFPDCSLSSGRIRRKNSLWKDSIHPGEQLRSIN